MTAFWVGAAVVVVVIVVLDRLSLQIVRPNPRKPDPRVADLGVAHEPMSIPSAGLELNAWLLTPDDEPAPPLVVLAHGWGANHSPLLQLGVPLASDGYEVLLFDVRGHGDNEPVPYTTVRHFRDDVMATVAYARGRFPDRPLVVVGHSLGGAAAVLAAAEGSAIDGLVLIAAPSDVIVVTGEYLRERGLPGGLMARLFLPFWWRRARSRFGPLTPTKRLPELDLPILVVQPEDDQRVSRGHAERLSAAAGVEPHIVLGAGHNDVLGHEETRRLVGAFLEGF